MFLTLKCYLRSVVADLYGKRWRIEQAFNTVKRLLDLSYLWTGSINGIKLQIWGTWMFYAILVDLGDAVADEEEALRGRILRERGRGSGRERAECQGTAREGEWMHVRHARSFLLRQWRGGAG